MVGEAPARSTMHKSIYLEGKLEFTLEPNGPILIKAGETGGADPTRPDMEFVRTSRRGFKEIYIPGPSLKGTVRAQAERIARSLERQGRDPAHDNPPLADNPMGDGTQYAGIDDMRYSSGRYIESIRDEIKECSDRTAVIYRRSSFVSQLFGHSSLASRVRFADAYGEGIVQEERNGVAIDRVYGSVAVGPFNYETAVAGQFTTVIDFKNVTLAQLALLGLALRDLLEGRIALGFGKSRGLGRVRGTFDALTLRYPTCEPSDGRLRLLNGRSITRLSNFAGVGAFVQDRAYAFPQGDVAPLPPGFAYEADEWDFGMLLRATDDPSVRAIFKACMPAWKHAIGIPT